MDKATRYRAKRMKKSDLFGEPKCFAWFLKPIAWLLSAEALGAKIEKIGMKGLKPPYLLFCNHQSFVDFKVATKAVFPRGYNNIVAVDGFIRREGIMRAVGCMCKRKFSNDLGLVMNIRRVLKKNGGICCIYPEARYSFCGSSGLIPKSTGKLVKSMGVPVVVLNMSGNFIRSPYWNRGKRKVPLKARMECVVTAEESTTLEPAEITARIAAALSHDDYRYQQDNNIRVKHRESARNLEQVLYKCPSCGAEFKFSSSGDTLSCGACGAEYALTEYGRMAKKGGGTEIEHPPAWFYWQRREARKEAAKPDYIFTDECEVWTLKDSNGFLTLPGAFTLIHDRAGFRLSGPFPDGEKTLEWRTEELYSVHDEIGDAVGQAISISAPNMTYYIFPKNRFFEIEKLRLTAEEMHKLVMGDGAHAVETINYEAEIGHMPE